MATNGDGDDFFSSSPNRDYGALKSKGRALARSGRLEESLDYLTRAYKLVPSSKLKTHISRIKVLVAEHGESSIEMVQICENFRMAQVMYENLYPYQREAVRWMWGLFQKKKGGVLGDDMGLGKTIQIIAFLSSMMEEQHIRTALLIMPVSLIENWKKEFIKWAPEIVVKEYHATSKKDREHSLRKVQLSGGVLLTTYGIVEKNLKLLQSMDERHFVWDYVVLDEGHKIRNPTKTTKAVHGLFARHRLVLTGTPVQNNLKELWALYDFVHQGTLLGSLQTFKMQYETPITRSRQKDATTAEQLLGSGIAENLRMRIDPYFLRRTKQEVLERKDEANGKEHCPSAFARLQRDMSMIRKNEFVVWVFLSPIQIKIYSEFLESDRVKNILVSKRSPLVELTVLKKISDHPRLLSHRSCLQLGLDGSMTEEELAEKLEDDATAYFDIKNTPDNVLIEESGKMGFLFNLLENLRSEGHRTLVFSQSCRILDIIQKVLRNRDWKVLRLDGKIRKTIDREKLIFAFQNDSSYPVFLLTSQVGGVGLTLTAADRVVIYDPSWNPATDSQAVDRAYRIGQTRSVVVYRLITCGSVEEKIYKRQIFKDSITQQTTGKSKDPHRYFTSQELRELFILDDPKFSTTQTQLESLHGGQRRTDISLDDHIAFLYSRDIFGISDHDLMFQGIQEEASNKEAVSEDYIKEKVKKAELLVSLESNLTSDTLIKTGSYAKEFNLPIYTNKSSGTQQVVDKYPPEYEIPTVDLSVEDLAIGIKSLDVTRDKIKLDVSEVSARSEQFCEIESSEDDEAAVDTKSSLTTERRKPEGAPAGTFCDIVSSGDESAVDVESSVAPKKIPLKLENTSPAIASPSEPFCVIESSEDEDIGDAKSSVAVKVKSSGASVASRTTPLETFWEIQSSDDEAVVAAKLSKSVKTKDLHLGRQTIALNENLQDDSHNASPVGQKSAVIAKDLCLGRRSIAIDEDLGDISSPFDQKSSAMDDTRSEISDSDDELGRNAFEIREKNVVREYSEENGEHRVIHYRGSEHRGDLSSNPGTSDASRSMSPHPADGDDQLASRFEDSRNVSLSANRSQSREYPELASTCSTTPEISDDEPEDNDSFEEMSERTVRLNGSNNLYSERNVIVKLSPNKTNPHEFGDEETTPLNENPVCLNGSNNLDSARNVIDKLSPNKFLSHEYNGDETTPLNELLDKFVSERIIPDKLSLTINKFRDHEFPVLTGSCSTTPEISDSDDDSEGPVKSSAVSVKASPPVDTETEDATYPSLCLGRESQKRSSPVLSVSDEEDGDSRMDSKKSRLRSPQTSSSPRKFVDRVQHKRDLLSNSLFTNKTTAVVQVDPFFSVKGKKHQPVRQFSSGSLYRHILNSKCPNESTNRKPALRESCGTVDDFQSATSELFEGIGDSFQEEMPSFTAASKASKDKKKKRRSQVFVIETSGEDSDEEPEHDRSLAESVGDSFHSPVTNVDETDDSWHTDEKPLHASSPLLESRRTSKIKDDEVDSLESDIEMESSKSDCSSSDLEATPLSPQSSFVVRRKKKNTRVITSDDSML